MKRRLTLACSLASLALAAVSPAQAQAADFGAGSAAFGASLVPPTGENPVCDASAAAGSVCVGYTSLSELLLDESREHMQNLRTGIGTLRAGISPSILTDGSRMPWVDPCAVALTLTGSIAHHAGRGADGDYHSRSGGLMLVAARALSSSLTLGADLSLSSARAKNSGMTLSADSWYFDLVADVGQGAFRRKAGIGIGVCALDTKRFIIGPAGSGSSPVALRGKRNSTVVNLFYEASYDLPLTRDGRHRLAPLALAEMSMAELGRLTEQGSPQPNPVVSFDNDAEYLALAAGLRYTRAWGMRNKPGYFTLDALIAQDIRSECGSMSCFSGGASPVHLQADRAGKTSLRLNAALVHPLNTEWALSARLSADIRSRKSMLGAALGIRYTF